MKIRQRVSLIAVLIIISFYAALGQELAPVYSARAYWLEEQNPRYQDLIMKQARGDSLKPVELEWLTYYNQYLKGYFERLNDQEKTVYQSKKDLWKQLKGTKPSGPEEQKQADQLTDAGNRSLFAKHVLYSGYYGFYYGLAIDQIFDLTGSTAAGVPLLTAGFSTLLPLLLNTNRQITNNSLMLAGHGKLVGWAHGYGLSAVLFGDQIAHGMNKVALSISALSSIGLGYLGNQLGRNSAWSEGRVALYRHYGLLTPITGMSLLASMKVENVHVLGAVILVSGFGGYCLADRIANVTDYTRGDIMSMKGLTYLNAFLGCGIWIDGLDAKQGSAFIPALGAISGTVIGHLWLKDYKLTTQAARKTVYAALGGGLVGEGLTVIVKPKTNAPYYIVPWLTGLIAYGLMVENVKTRNEIPLNSERHSFLKNFYADFQPQNLMVSRMMISKETGLHNLNSMLPPPILTVRYQIH